MYLSKSVFQLTATATEELAQTPYSRGIPSSQITMAGKNLGADGYAYAVYPDNATVDCTPKTSADFYSFTVGAGKHTLTS